MANAGMLLVATIWGVNFSVTKGAFDSFHPLAFTGIRFTLASLLLVPLVRYLEGDERLPRGALTRLVILGVVGNTLYQLAWISGLERTTASNSALILSAMPTIVAIMAVALGLERFRPKVLGGVIVATAGVVLVVAARGTGFGRATMAGDLLTVAALLCWAGYTLGLRALPPEISSLRVTMVTTVAGAPVLLLAGLPAILRTDWGAVPWQGWTALAYATVLSLLVAYLIWNRSVKVVGPSRTVIYMCLTPLIAVAAAAVLLGERPRPLQAVGAVLIIAGVVLTVGQRSEPGSG
jgi:drug/metabolite transporter (DMT)-like permease